jgi:SAM-dependent methyltransferase
MALQYATVAPVANYVHEKTSLDFLDDVLDKLLRGNVDIGMIELGNRLHDLYASTSDSEWEHLLNNSLLKHPLKDVLMQDPLTARSFVQPRNYAGDAVLIDMVYFPNKTDLSQVSPLGKKLHSYTTRTPLSRNLSRRLKTISNYIDTTAKRTHNARILSVASGHCRELEFSDCIKKGGIGRFVALDHDTASLERMMKDYGSLGIEPLPLSISEIVKGRAHLGQFDLIYAAGLYDYLGTRLARRLTSELYKMLAPGGKLVLINIDVDYGEIGFLESYMNWSMIGRGKTELLDLASDLNSHEHASLNVQNGGLISSHYNILEIEKK